MNTHTNQAQLQLMQGNIVKIHGLRGATHLHLNGTKGRLKSFRSNGKHAGRWAVRVHGTGNSNSNTNTLAIKTANLQKVDKEEALRESLEEHNLLVNNKIYYDEYMEVESGSDANAMNICRAIETILFDYPKVLVILDAHAGKDVDRFVETEDEDIDLPLAFGQCDLFGNDVCEVILYASDPDTEDRERFAFLEDRIRIRSWGNSVSRKAKEGRGWVEVYFRIGLRSVPGLGYEAPERSNVYCNVSFPHEMVHDNMLHVQRDEGTKEGLRIVDNRDFWFGVHPDGACVLGYDHYDDSDSDDY